MWPCVKFSSQQGIAFLAVLIFMQIIAMFSLCAIETIIVETRTAHGYYQHHLLFTVAEGALKQAERSNLAACDIPVTASAELPTEPLEWWQSHASCAGNFQQFEYYYVTEYLGNDACAYVLPDKKTTADYFRVTVLATDNSGDQKVFLQTTFVKSSPLSTTCDRSVHSVQAGRQSWNEIV